MADSGSGVPADPVVDGHDRSRAYARHAWSANTRRAYAAAWRRFETWCDGQGVAALPAVPSDVAAYLAVRADAGAKLNTLSLALAAIAFVHRGHGVVLDTRDPALAIPWKGIRTTVGRRRPIRRTVPALPEALKAMVAALDRGTPAGARDAALLLLGFAAALRRSELVALTAGDVCEQPEGLVVTVRAAKTDQTGQGAAVAVPRSADPAHCPVAAVRAWVMVARRHPDQPLFTRVFRNGRVAGDAALSGRAVALIVQRTARAAGLATPEAYAGHSLRAGLATAAARNGVSLDKLKAQTRHKSLGILLDYIRDADQWRDNAAEGLL